MREIEFRGLRKDGKGWVHGVPFHIYEEGKCFMINNCQSSTLEQDDTDFQGFEVVPSTVGQYTGMKDDKGTKIFEGDNVEYLGAKGYVFYEKELAMYMIKFYKPAVSSYSFDSIEGYIEVFGNIHEGGEK